MTSEKTYAVEQRIDDQVTNGWSIPFEVVKGADEGRTSTTYVDDADLQVLAVPAGIYKMELDLVYSGGAGGSETDLKIDLQPPSGTSLLLIGICRLASDGGALHQLNVTGTAADTGALWTNGVSLLYGASFRGSVNIITAGDFVFRWAAGVNNGTNTTLRATSRMSLSRRI